MVDAYSSTTVLVTFLHLFTYSSANLRDLESGYSLMNP